jgi:hypothetical protein
VEGPEIVEWCGDPVPWRGAGPDQDKPPGRPSDAQSRYIEAAVGGVLVASIYAPNGNPQPGPKFDYKLAWLDRLRRHATMLRKTGAPVVLAGDFNVAPTDLDIYPTNSWRNDALIQPESRAAFKKLVGRSWTDALRHLHPDERIYTFWHYMRDRWQRDAGLRLDHLLLSPNLRDRLRMPAWTGMSAGVKERAIMLRCGSGSRDWHSTPISDVRRFGYKTEAGASVVSMCRTGNRAQGTDSMAEERALLFDDRFMERHAGSIISDPAIAIVELVANAWDAWATQVDIVWPELSTGVPFVIRDNGKGMTEAQFQTRWKTLDYNRVREEGAESPPPPELAELRSRAAYGRNGKGRHAALRFGKGYQVRTWRDGTSVTFEVRRGVTQPFTVESLAVEHDVEGHGTEITAVNAQPLQMTPEEAREVIGTRFLADPNFAVAVNGTEVTFDDIPEAQLRTVDVDVPGVGTVHLIMIDTQKADKTTRHHGIAWRVTNRIVGTPGWIGFDQERLVDGRSSEAKRFIFIARADFLADDVLPDWSGFWPKSGSWHATRSAVTAGSVSTSTILPLKGAARQRRQSAIISV